MRSTLALAILLSVVACTGDDDDSARADDDDATDDDSAAGDDDDSAAGDDDDSAAGDDDDATPPGELCAYALEAACADVVVDAPGASGLGFGDPFYAVNGVRGDGLTGSGVDVYSMGLDPDVNDTLVLAWSGRRVIDGPGIDVVVFENAFEVTGPEVVFMDLVIVEVSADGETWVAWPHAYLGEDPDAYSPNPALWDGFAGKTPVLLHVEDNPTDPVDVGLAGGDGFDLADLPDETLRTDGVEFIRLRAAGTEFPADLVSNGPDIDGVYAALLEAL